MAASEKEKIAETSLPHHTYKHKDILARMRRLLMRFLTIIIKKAKCSGWTNLKQMKNNPHTLFPSMGFWMLAKSKKHHRILLFEQKRKEKKSIFIMLVKIT